MEEGILIKIRGGSIASLKGLTIDTNLRNMKLNLKRGLIEIHGLSNTEYIKKLLLNINKLHNVTGSRDVYVLAENYNALVAIYFLLSPKKVVLITNWHYLVEPELINIVCGIIEKINTSEHTVKIGADSVDTLRYLVENCLSKNTHELVISKLDKSFCKSIDDFDSITLFHSNSYNVATINFSERTIRIYLKSTSFLKIAQRYIETFKNMFDEVTVICETNCNEFMDLAKLIHNVLWANKIKIDTAVIERTRLYFQLNQNSLFVQGDIKKLNQTLLENALRQLLGKKSLKIFLDENKQLIFGS